MRKRASQNARHKGATSQAPGNAAPVQLVQIEKPVYGGAFLARVAGKAVFVPLALPGEQALVRIIQDKGGYANAEAEQIVEAAPQRVTPACRHFAACGGCQYQHADYTAQLTFKQAILRETLERGGVRAPQEIAVLSAKPWAYRNRIRLAVNPDGNVGYRGRRSHIVVEIAECPIAAPVLVQAALAAADLFRRFGRPSRPVELSLFSNAAGDFLLASVFTAGPAQVPLTDYFGALIQEIKPLRGVELVEMHRGQLPRRIAQAGEVSLAYHAAGFDYRVGHGAFFQVNRWLVDELVECVTAGYSGALAWDLFAGVGLFARRLAGSFGQVIAVESAPAATADLTQNLAGASATAVHASTIDFLRKARAGVRPDLVVADPPRTGLGPEITSLLGEIAASALVYVSCDPATLARDLRALLSMGYAIERITLADLFPQTFHLETVVRLHR